MAGSAGIPTWRIGFQRRKLKTPPGRRGGQRRKKWNGAPGWETECKFHDATMAGSEQFEFAFSEGSPVSEAATHWRAEWMRVTEDLCRRLAVPLHHQAEVPLTQGPILRRRICLDEEQLSPDGDRHRLVLRIGQAAFRLGEMESVLRLDEPREPPTRPQPER